MTRPRKYRRISLDSIDEPTESITSGVENLFDVAMVFAVALIVALAAFWQSPLLFEQPPLF